MTAKILLLAADLAICTGVKKLVAARIKYPITIKCSTMLSEALELLGTGPFDLLLADFDLPDCQVLEGLEKVRSLLPELPVAVVCAAGDAVLEAELRERGVCAVLRRAELGRTVPPPELAALFDCMSTKGEHFLDRALSDIVFGSATDGVISVDEAGKVVRMNATAERLTGWTLLQARGTQVAEVMPLLNAVTRRPELHPMELILRLGETVRFPVGYVLLRGDGAEITIDDTSAPIIDPVLDYNAAAGRISTVSAVITAGVELVRSGEIWKHLAISGWRAGLGFVIGGSLK